jgi:translation initiation factor 2 subunit 3
MANMFMQPIVNIGMLGSVSDGKSTTVYSLSGVKTQRHSSEMKRNITIKPGYANMKIYRDEDGYNVKERGKIVHNVSFIDCPGHYQLIVTMMSNIRLMDGIILVVSAAEPIEKKPQLLQHIAAIKLSGIKNVIVLLNKLDLVTKKIAMERYESLINILNRNDIEPKRIIPVCMNHMIGVDMVLESIMEFMPPKERETYIDPLFMISRSFDVNHPHIPYTDIMGGVVGGSVLRGQFKVGDEIEISPGIIMTKKDGTIEWTPHRTTISSLKSDTTELDKVLPGGLIGIGTNIDPYYCKNDGMAGQMVGLKGKMPPTMLTLTTTFEKIEFDGNTWEPKNGANITVITGTYCGDGKITSFDENAITIKLLRPVCIDKDNMIVLCEKTREAFHIVGCGYYYE